MPEWFTALLTVIGATVGAYAAIRVEVRFLWRDLDRLTNRVEDLERFTGHRRRWTDKRAPVRSDA